MSVLVIVRNMFNEVVAEHIFEELYLAQEYMNHTPGYDFEVYEV